ncbi:MAG: hypothetical protein IJ747_07505 [Lachnospiraceae bacterium]|nr:hypothetical protein [Lachnospiraceae bacterium]
MEKSLFRKKTLDRIQSPEQLTDYLRVATPGVWIVLAIVLLILTGLIAWSTIGTLETKTDVKVVVTNHVAQVLTTDGTGLSEGMPLTVSGKETVIASASEDAYGRSLGIAEVMLPDGTYDGIVVTETIHPFDFLVASR